MALHFEGFEGHPLIYGISDRNLRVSGLLSALGASDCRPVYLEQTHRAKIFRIEAATDLYAPLSGCDGAVTDLKGIAIAVLTADCLPIFLYDPLKQAIGIAHAGWRGTYEGIAVNLLNEMKAAFNSSPSCVLVGFGPAIRRCCYEVKSDFLGRFPDSVVETARGCYFDLAAENLSQLLSAGVSQKNIFDCGVCTCCRAEEFYSYRREGAKAGRMASIIMLKGG